MKVQDIWVNKKGIKYGYCGCGREVRKDQDDECPHCFKELDWGEEKKWQE